MSGRWTLLLGMAVSLWAGGSASCAQEDERFVDLGEVRVDREERTFSFPAEVVLQKGVLELFACARGTKEHESIFAVDALGRHLHAAALLLGATPGRPVAYQGDTKPPSGTRVSFEVDYEADGARKRVPAHELVRNVATGKTLEQPFWVFVGSKVVETREGPRYLAELTGALVVTYNDPSAVFDNPSSFGSDDTVYEANTEAIPPPGTKVLIIGKVHPEGQPE